jgi:NAD/NADP transhydrogenase alpha subunit
VLARLLACYRARIITDFTDLLCLLQAKCMGAIVRAFDVRSTVKEQIVSAGLV